jgi:rubrerythrin
MTYNIPTRKKLNYMIADERKAPKEYRKLYNLLKKKKDKKVISGIIRDEKKHLKKLEKIKRKK